ncbi:MAG: ABC transporter permease, partial [Treponema sp.]|nr:ABC transporter permease [Treponema sp.]
MLVPQYPEFIPVGLELKDELHPRLSLTPDGVSEFTFSNLYLFRRRYRYRVSMAEGNFIISGERDGKKFFMTPCAMPG